MARIAVGGRLLLPPTWKIVPWEGVEKRGFRDEGKGEAGNGSVISISIRCAGSGAAGTGGILTAVIDCWGVSRWMCK